MSRSRSPAPTSSSREIRDRDSNTVEEGAKLYVGNLSFKTDTVALKEAFGKFGEVVEAFVANDRETGRSKGFGFVTFGNKEDAAKALNELNNNDLDGRNIRVDFATGKPNGGGGRGGGRGGGFRGDRRDNGRSYGRSGDDRRDDARRRSRSRDRYDDRRRSRSRDRIFFYYFHIYILLGDDRRRDRY